jgi:hypothetical protein
MLGVAGILTQALVYQPITDGDPKNVWRKYMAGAR